CCCCRGSGGPGTSHSAHAPASASASGILPDLERTSTARCLLLGGLGHHLGPLGLLLCTSPLASGLLDHDFLALSLFATHRDWRCAEHERGAKTAAQAKRRAPGEQWVRGAVNVAAAWGCGSEHEDGVEYGGAWRGR